MNDKAERSIVCLFPDNQIDGLEKFRQIYIKNSGKAVPFHITLLYDFYLPHEIDETVVSKLTSIARKTPKFDFFAKPLSSFPTTNVLYLSPVPVTPIEELTEKLYKTFPEFGNKKFDFPVYHMTIAFGQQVEEKQRIIEEYFEKFGKDPFVLKAGKIGIYIKNGNAWSEYMSFDLG